MHLSKRSKSRNISLSNQKSALTAAVILFDLNPDRLAVSHSNHYIRMFSVPAWGCTLDPIHTSMSLSNSSN